MLDYIALFLVALQAAILVSPSIVRYFRHAYRSDRVCHLPALCHQHINLPKLREDHLKGADQGPTRLGT